MVSTSTLYLFLSFDRCRGWKFLFETKNRQTNIIYVCQALRIQVDDKSLTRYVCVQDFNTFSHRSFLISYSILNKEKNTHSNVHFRLKL